MNMVDFGMEPQSALDAPRFCVGAGKTVPWPDQRAVPVALEQGVGESVLAELKRRGHNVSGGGRAVDGAERENFGRGQIVRRVAASVSGTRATMWAGSDPRADGCAMGLHAAPPAL